MNVLAVSCLGQEFIRGMGSDFNQKGQIPAAGATSTLTILITVNTRGLANERNEC